jgi:outer membrane protein OmpA-like peptidoglycan-associated protein
MRKLLLSLTCFTALLAEQSYLYEISPLFGIVENGKSSGLNSSFSYGMQFQYNDVDFVIKPEVAYIYSPGIEVYADSSSVNSHLLMFNGVYDIEYTPLLTPFLKSGVGYQHIDKAPKVISNAFIIGAGGGFKLNLRDHLALKFETTVTLHNFEKSNILAFCGIDFSFGQEENIQTAVIEIEKPEMAEQDGSADRGVTFHSQVVLTKEKQPEHYNEEIVIRNEKGEITSITLFVAYLFRGYDVDAFSKELLRYYLRPLNSEKIRLRVIGHTDTKGRRAYNKELSLKRAEAVKKVLIGYGFDPQLISTEGRGEEQPLHIPVEQKGHLSNDRIEVIIEDMRK